MRKYFKWISRMQHTVISISFWKLILQYTWILDFLTSLSLDMHILANTQHAHKRTWPGVLDVCYTPSSNDTSIIWDKHTHLSFYLWGLPAALLRCIRLSALQIRDRLLRIKCHVCSNQIPGLGGDAESDGKGDERRKRRRNMVIHLLVSREGLIPLLLNNWQLSSHSETADCMDERIKNELSKLAFIRESLIDVN